MSGHARRINAILLSGFSSHSVRNCARSGIAESSSNCSVFGLVIAVSIKVNVATAVESGLRITNGRLLFRDIVWIVKCPSAPSVSRLESPLHLQRHGKGCFLTAMAKKLQIVPFPLETALM